MWTSKRRHGAAGAWWVHAETIAKTRVGKHVEKRLLAAAAEQRSAVWRSRTGQARTMPPTRIGTWRTARTTHAALALSRFATCRFY